MLRHVSDAFHEDPVRILRVARFAARFGFRIADETMALMKSMVDTGEADHLVPERVWQEFSRGLGEDRPELMFEALERCDFRPKLLPELKDDPAELFRPAAGALRGAVLAARRRPRSKALCDRLRCPTRSASSRLLACRCQRLLDASQAGEILNLFKRADALRRPERFAQLLQVATLARPGFDGRTISGRRSPPRLAVDAGAVARRALGARRRFRRCSTRRASRRSRPASARLSARLAPDQGAGAEQRHNPGL